MQKRGIDFLRKKVRRKTSGNNRKASRGERGNRGIGFGRTGGNLFYYPLLSEYQAEPENRPKMIEVIVVEVVWNERQHFCTAREKLDKFSTFGEEQGSVISGQETGGMAESGALRKWPESISRFPDPRVMSTAYSLLLPWRWYSR